jgi:hypothetical protein
VWNGEYAAINSFGIGGTNSHLILKRPKERTKILQKIHIPRLMVVSGRTETSVRSLLDKVKFVTIFCVVFLVYNLSILILDRRFQVQNLQYDNEFCALLYSVFNHHVPHFNYRAFAVYDEATTSEITVKFF